MISSVTFKSQTFKLKFHLLDLANFEKIRKFHKKPALKFYPILLINFLKVKNKLINKTEKICCKK